MRGHKWFLRLLPSGVRYSLISGQFGKLRDAFEPVMHPISGRKPATYVVNAPKGYRYWRNDSAGKKNER